MRLRWPAIIEEAARIVSSYDTGVTLRQCFYRLVSAELIPNKPTTYTYLSNLTAEARRQGAFPEFIDQGREIHQPATFSDTADALQYLYDIYRRDRTQGQRVSVYLGVEKLGMVEQLVSWFSDFGVPIVALGGFASQTYVKNIQRDITRQHRPAVLIYAGDFDASGWAIYRDFTKRVGLFAEEKRVAITLEQIRKYKIPKLAGKETDPRRDQHVAEFGSNIQVELDALDPNVLRGIYQDALYEYLDLDVYEKVLRREKRDKATLTK